MRNAKELREGISMLFFAQIVADAVESYTLILVPGMLAVSAKVCISVR